MSGDDEMIFDPNMSKKKKKKKKPFMLDEEGGDGASEDAPQPEAKEVEVDGGEDRELDFDEDDGRRKEISDDLDDLNFFNQKKKKKKKPKTFDNDVEEGIKELKIETEPSETNGEGDLMLELGKKKRKSKAVNFDMDDDMEIKDDAQEDDDGKNTDDITFSSTQLGPAWAGSERDYTYDELLNRVFQIMREKNPDMVAGEKRKFVMKPPQVVRVGTKKSSFVNFTDICKL
nr:Eukaryotic translation initiation factor 2 subunit 2 [Salmo salar]